ncbi:hypothetical protein EGW08_019514 [Elysia chlorotica]|uniref:Uncharacterized protein n=1 Tax=Elysia chlorotica TaxID=188477 RepID=A0A3S1B5S4_ELYCH|nr:hypothetical protein EGW08_019514 [Elysia chlorotica]
MGEDCSEENFWLQIPYFCGHHPACTIPGNEWALQEAKRNLYRHYLVVGITEDFDSFLSVLETILPRFYRGARLIGAQNRIVRRTARKIPPLPETRKQLEASKIYRMEREFYDFARAKFQTIKYKIQNNLLHPGEKIIYQNLVPKTL